MTSQEQFLAEIEAFLDRHNMAPTMFGLRVLNDGRFLARLRSGKSTTLLTADAVRGWMAEYEAAGPGADIPPVVARRRVAA